MFYFFILENVLVEVESKIFMKKYFLVVVTWLTLLGLTTALSNEPKSTNNGEYSVLYLTFSTQDYVSTLKAVDSYKEMKSEDLNLV